MSEIGGNLLSLQKQIAEHPCSWCGRTREELPEGERHFTVFHDEASDTIEMACDVCMASEGLGVLMRFAENRRATEIKAAGRTPSSR